MLNAKFRCNLCGAANVFNPDGDWREAPSCSTCGSSVRVRQLVHCLTTKLFGSARSLPGLKASQIRGIGLSDPDILASRLAASFNYTNTFYHTDPRLDICDPGPEWISTNDFVISSDVFEHVPSPVQRAFDGAFAVLRPGGLMLLTVPFDERTGTTEHFPNVRDFKLLNFDADWLLVGRTDAGGYELHDDLTFHGGPGTTVEMRFFSRQAVIDHLSAAGFVDISVFDRTVPAYGIFPPHHEGVPITARKPG